VGGGDLPPPPQAVTSRGKMHSSCRTTDILQSSRAALLVTSDCRSCAEIRCEEWRPIVTWAEGQGCGDFVADL